MDRNQDSLHIGTHPPGLIVAQCLLLNTMDRSPALAGLLTNFMPPSVQVGFRQLELMHQRPIRRSERATLYATALLTLFACAGTVAASVSPGAGRDAVTVGVGRGGTLAAGAGREPLPA